MIKKWITTSNFDSFPFFFTAYTIKKVEIRDSDHSEYSGEQDDVIKWKHFPRYWPFVRGIHRSRSFDVFFHLRLNKRLSKQPWGWWFETAGWSFWRHRTEYGQYNGGNALAHYVVRWLSTMAMAFVPMEWRLTNMAANQIWRTLRKRPIYLISNKIIAQDNTYIHIRAKTPIKSNLLYKCWFTEDSETVLKDVIYGKPKQIRPTTQSY